MEQPPGGGEPRKAEEGPYNEAMLDAEIAGHATQSKDLEDPARAFVGFQNNFYWLVPGGKAEAVVKQTKDVFAHDPKQAVEINSMNEKKIADAKTIIDSMQPRPDPGLLARAARLSSKDADAVKLVRNLYIAMRNLGYSHRELVA